MDERKALEWDTLSSPGTVHSRQQKIIDAFWFWWKEDLKMRYIGLPCDCAYTNTSKRWFTNQADHTPTNDWTKIQILHDDTIADKPGKQARYE